MISGQIPCEENYILMHGNTMNNTISRKNFMTSAETVYRMINDLPPDLRSEAIHYIEELAKRKNNLKMKKFRLTWAGGLSHLRDSTTSVELQHAAPTWRD